MNDNTNSPNDKQALDILKDEIKQLQSEFDLLAFPNILSSYHDVIIFFELRARIIAKQDDLPLLDAQQAKLDAQQNIIDAIKHNHTLMKNQLQAKLDALETDLDIASTELSNATNRIHDYIHTHGLGASGWGRNIVTILLEHVEAQQSKIAALEAENAELRAQQEEDLDAIIARLNTPGKHMILRSIAAGNPKQMPTLVIVALKQIGLIRTLRYGYYELTPLGKRVAARLGGGE